MKLWQNPSSQGRSGAGRTCQYRGRMGRGRVSFARLTVRSGGEGAGEESRGACDGGTRAGPAPDRDHQRRRSGRVVTLDAPRPESASCSPETKLAAWPPCRARFSESSPRSDGEKQYSAADGSRTGCGRARRASRFPHRRHEGAAHVVDAKSHGRSPADAGAERCHRLGYAVPKERL